MRAAFSADDAAAGGDVGVDSPSWPRLRSFALGGSVVTAATVFYVAGLGATPAAIPVFLLLVFVGYAIASTTGLLVFALSAAAYLTLRALEPEFAKNGIGVLLAAETWAPVTVLALAAAAGEAYRRVLVERDLRLAAGAKAREAAEERAAEDARLSRSLGAVAGGLLSSFEPDRMLRRFTALLRTLLGADAALSLVVDESRNTFQILEASGTGEESLAELRQVYFPLGNISRDGIAALSFSAGDAGLLADLKHI